MPMSFYLASRVLCLLSKFFCNEIRLKKLNMGKMFVATFGQCSISMVIPGISFFFDRIRVATLFVLHSQPANQPARQPASQSKGTMKNPWIIHELSIGISGIIHEVSMRYP